MSGALLALMALLAATSPVRGAASDTTIVSASVPAVTSLATNGCAPGISDATAFGPIPAGTGRRTGVDCTIGFGSSNARAILRVQQHDGTGSAMSMSGTGELDPAFGTAGLAQHDNAPGTAWDYANTVEVDPSGRVLTGGKCVEFPYYMACIMRYLPDGSVDPSFNGGVPARFDEARTLSGNSHNDPNEFAELEIDPAGRILAAGSCDTSANAVDFCLTRLLDDGTPDPTFGQAGVQVYAPLASSFGGDKDDYPTSLVLEPDGSIVVGGACTVWNNVQADPCVVYFEPNGAVDFDRGIAGGTTVFAHPSVDPAVSRFNEVTDLERTADGGILASARCTLTGAQNTMCVARLRQDGRLDPTFGDAGTPGFATPILSSAGRGTSLTQDAAGGIYVAGNCTVNGAACVAHLTANGALDTTWGTNSGYSLAATGTEYEWPDRVRRMGDTSVDLLSWCRPAAGVHDVCITRFDATTGLRDTTYGTGGTARHATNGGQVDGNWNAIWGDIAEVDGGYVWGGNCVGEGDTCMLRIASGESVDDYGDPGATWSGSESMFGMCLEGTSAGTSAAGWTPAATCPAADGAHWRAVPTSSASVAATDVVATSGTARIRFGLKLASDQPPGAYHAPLAFSVVAP